MDVMLCQWMSSSKHIAFIFRVMQSEKHYMSYIETQLDVLISHIYSWNETLHVSDSSPVHHQEFFTVHTAVVYVIQVC